MASKKRAPGAPRAQLVDGKAVVVLPDGREIEFEILEAKLVIEDVQRKHNATEANGDWATREYFADLAREFATMLGIETMGTTAAWQLADRVVAEFIALKKSISDGPS